MCILLSFSCVTKNHFNVFYLFVSLPVDNSKKDSEITFTLNGNNFDFVKMTMQNKRRKGGENFKLFIRLRSI